MYIPLRNVTVFEPHYQELLVPSVCAYIVPIVQIFEGLNSCEWQFVKI